LEFLSNLFFFSLLQPALPMLIAEQQQELKDKDAQLAQAVDPP
jgi:hypothetical protein